MKTKYLASITAFVLITSLAGPMTALAAGPALVNLLSADSFVILSKTGITDVPTSNITGNIGSSPITGAAIGVTCVEVTGTIYSTDAAGPLPCALNNPVLLTTAVSDMEAAYTDAAGRVSPDQSELFAGNLGGQTLVPGLYKWSTDVTIPTDVTLSGGANDVWIFQISGDLSIASAQKVLLSGGAQASNVFWQVGGGAGATLGTTSIFNGTILTAKQVIIQTGATLNGRALAQTQVTLDQNIISFPTYIAPPAVVSTPVVSGGGGGSGTIGGHRRDISDLLAPQVQPQVLGASTVVPSFPNTGYAPNEINVSWDISRFILDLTNAIQSIF